MATGEDVGPAAPKRAPQAPVAEAGVPIDRLRALNDALLALPQDFAVHPKLVKPRSPRWAR